MANKSNTGSKDFSQMDILISILKKMDHQHRETTNRLDKICEKFDKIVEETYELKSDVLVVQDLCEDKVVDEEVNVINNDGLTIIILKENEIEMNREVDVIGKMEVRVRNQDYELINNEIDMPFIKGNEVGEQETVINDLINEDIKEQDEMRVNVVKVIEENDNTDKRFNANRNCRQKEKNQLEEEVEFLIKNNPTLVIEFINNRGGKDKVVNEQEFEKRCINRNQIKNITKNRLRSRKGEIIRGNLKRKILKKQIKGLIEKSWKTFKKKDHIK